MNRLLVLVLMAGVACGPLVPADAGVLPELDGGSPADAGGPPDAGAPDAGGPDAGAPDAGPPDAGAAASCEVDNGGCDPTRRCVSTGAGVTCLCVPVPVDFDTPLAGGAAVPFPTATGQQTKSARWGSPAGPLPTNTSWINFVVGGGENRVDVLPYQVRAEPVWLAVGSTEPTTTATLVVVPERKQLLLGALEFGGSTSRVVQSYDLLSVTLQYRQAAGTMTVPLVFGSPYLTLDYEGLRPRLVPPTASITSVNGSGAAGTVTGTRFALTLSDGSTWLLYASSSLSFAWTPGNLLASAAFTGSLRLAQAPTAAAIAVLDAHAATIPRGGTVEASVTCDTAALRFAWQVTGPGPLLMGALPHHLARLSTPVTALRFPTIRGPLVGVEGASWTMTLPLSTVRWSAPRPPAANRLAAVRAALLADAAFVPNAATVSADSYFGGKQLAKLARLASIADDLGETATAATLRARLAPLVAAWLTGTNGNPFVYDTTWGGVVTRNALASPSESFGSGHYNDHHFHYGYLLYAAAVVARANPGFATTHRAALLALVRDIANPSAADPRFPRFRHFDFFRAHSWAGGLQENPDGQDQESSSEAVNAWYAMHLLGLAMGDRNLSELGRLQLALEIDAARFYYQVPLATPVYQAPFANNGCVGRLYETRATFDTFFGAEAFKVFGIQMLPYTPVTEELISPTWVGDRWTNMRAAAMGIPPAWVGFEGFLYMAHAVVDRDQAWTEVSALSGWDDGNSKANALWWVATRP